MDKNNVGVLDPAHRPAEVTPDPRPYRMDADLANAACAMQGATTERARAALMGVSTATVYRWRDGRTPPRLDVVDTVCRRLGVARSELFPGLR